MGETDLISRQAAIDTLAEMYCKSDEDGYVWIIRSDAWARIDTLPAAEPERKVGEWIIDHLCSTVGGTYQVLRCSVCEHQEPWQMGRNYCPNCGADMRGETDETDRC